MSTIPHADLEAWRTEFPILQTRTYLNSCSLGALSRRSMGYLGEYQALWNTMGASAWYELWMARIGQLKQTVATMWNADEKEIAISPSVSGALSSIASAIDYGTRNKIVVAELDFPTLVYQWLAKNGVEVVRVPSDDGIGVPPERWAEYVDERTALVATSHVFYGTGYVQDLAPIAAAARKAGALFLVDGYQS
ncbi:MAG TPA: aminotransferase class V-fold PLP-dependent enzyme, partial [Longimicrobium sp.]|uniref:aminotransferase class V-fold PLP-dependent enzyme n=1 Tax=Longimicrobium sp. TaxID=2029185 RepID=UPI002ED8C956